MFRAAVSDMLLRVLTVALPICGKTSVIIIYKLIIKYVLHI
jgi:hypothetical protein